MPDAATQQRITLLWREESGRIVALLMRTLGDLGRAEELAQDTFLAALEQWPSTGLPERPGAWLMTTARNKALNALAHARMQDRKHEAMGHEPAVLSPDEGAMEGEVQDDLLRLLFIACHPLLAMDGRVALTLRLVGGLSTEEIARAFLVPETTMAQRIVRAKKTLSLAGVPFELPQGEALAGRLAAVLKVVYLIFNEGHTASAGPDVMRPALAAEAIRLGRLLANLAPSEPEVLSLQSLMELTAARGPARTDPAGDPILLMDQDRTLWDQELLQSGASWLARAEALGGDAGPYRLQAEIVACHARAATAEDTDWKRIAGHYAELARLSPSPIVELNRAVAVSRAEGPAAGLALLDELQHEPSLADYPLLAGARADLLFRLGRLEEARSEFLRAASLSSNDRQRQRLLDRARECGS